MVPKQLGRIFCRRHRVDSTRQRQESIRSLKSTRQRQESVRSLKSIRVAMIRVHGSFVSDEERYAPPQVLDTMHSENNGSGYQTMISIVVGGRAYHGPTRKNNNIDIVM
jgi:hypothetical protein